MARILAVDDQPQILKLLETLLTQRGHHITTAHDSFDAVEKLTAATFELIITDAIMPGGSGFDLIRTIRRMEGHAKTPVILLTGRREKKDVERGIQVGADDYMVKPVDPDLLIAKVDSLLQQKYGAAVQFNECAISEEAQHLNKVRIVGVSEVGMTLHSDQPFHVGTKVTLASPFFVKVGIVPPILRVTESEKLPGDNAQFTTTTQFVGITEKSLQPLRVWIRGRGFHQAG